MQDVQVALTFGDGSTFSGMRPLSQEPTTYPDPMSAGLKRLFRSPARTLRRVLNGILHPSRRRKAEEVVRSGIRSGKILFVCTGNICRSPYAEKVFQRALDGRFVEGAVVLSAGFLAAGRSSPEPAVRIASERGLSLDDHRSRQIDAAMLAEAGLVVVMETEHRRRLEGFGDATDLGIVLLGDLDPGSPGRRDILDPWGHPDELFREAFDRIDRCVDRLLALLPEGSSPQARR